MAFIGLLGEIYKLIYYNVLYERGTPANDEARLLECKAVSSPLFLFFSLLDNPDLLVENLNYIFPC